MIEYCLMYFLDCKGIQEFKGHKLDYTPLMVISGNAAVSFDHSMDPFKTKKDCEQYAKHHYPPFMHMWHVCAARYADSETTCALFPAPRNSNAHGYNSIDVSKG